MGCTQSKIENEEAVSRCKDRKQFMKEAVTTRNAFAAAHSAYTMALKNTGAALSDYGQGEVHDLHHHHASIHPSVFHQIPPTPPSYENLPPPPPPLPNFSPAPPLKRANTMPEFSIPRPDLKSSDPIQEEEGDGEEDHIHDEEEQMEEDHVADHDLTHRRSRGGGGSGRAAESAAPRPPPSPPRTPPTEAFPPPPPEAKGMTWDYFFMVENMPGPSLSETDEIRPSDNDESDGGGYMNNGYKRSEGPIAGGGSNGVGGRNGNNEEPQPDSEPEPRTPEKVIEPEAVPVPKPMKKPKQVVHSNSAPADAARRGGGGKPPANNVSLMKILSDLDDHFLRASESAHEVSKMLEATRLHYHSNFADNRGHIDHSARVMRVITWNRSFRGLPNGDDGKDDFDAEEHETHATVLDKLLAWEKKLYDEVKAGELMKLEYQRKIALLNKQKKRGASTESLEKTKAAVSHLHTRYIVDMQSMDSTVSEINHLRDDQLYPKLVALVDGMAKMWDSMHVHHESQLKNVLQLRSLDVCQGPKETSEQHHERTAQLCGVVQEWHSQFQKLVSHQKEYIQALNSWLKLNLIPIESSLKEKVTSPPRPHQPAIEPLLHAWHEHLEKLPAELAGNAIFSFAGIIKNIILHQEEEAKLKEKCEETRKEFTRKSRAFEDWYNKYIQRKTPEEMGPDRTEDTSHKDEVAERQFVVENLKKKLDEETEVHQKHCRQVREKSLGSLKTHLPELFRAMSDFSSACSDMYKSLQSLSQPRRQKQQQRDPSQS